jgi:hypothetical protein
MSAGASEMHERALETYEPNCVPRTVKSFFIPMIHSPSGATGHVTTPELRSQKGRAPGRGRRGSTGALLSEKQSPESWDTWQHRNSPQQGGEIWSRGTCGSAGAHLSNEVRFGAEGHVVTPKLTSTRRRGPGP